MQGKTAVILFNLGGPDGQASIRPFLYNFFMDANIIALPKPLRWCVAQLISRRRSKGAAESSYRHLGFVSPLLKNTQAQAHALERALQNNDSHAAGDIRVFPVMRYWHPRAAAVAREVKDFAPDRVIMLSLYPQYSTTTVKSSFDEWRAAAAAANITAKHYEVCCYPLDEGFIEASVKNIRAGLASAPPRTRVLFSAHGLPEKIIKGGDPYQWQCEQSAKAIVAALDIPGLDWQICYQSRVGPMKWIGPSTDDAIEKAACDGVGVLIYPHAFVSEHVETLVEIDIEYREKAQHLGIPYFGKVDTAGTTPDFIHGLARQVRGVYEQGGCTRICPVEFKCCGCRPA